MTRNGHPIGELVPLRTRREVPREQFASRSANAPVVDIAWFRADQDAAIDTEPHDRYDR